MQLGELPIIVNAGNSPSPTVPFTPSDSLQSLCKLSGACWRLAFRDAGTELEDVDKGEAGGIKACINPRGNKPPG